MDKQKDMEKNQDIFFDADDFSEENTGWELLRYIKRHIPDFRANLFTVLGKCSDDFIKDIKKIDWIDMIPHGWMHETPLECKEWSYNQSIEYLDRIACYNITKGFKAPGWQISDGMYQALLEKDYWVADQSYNDHRRPKELRAYIIDSPNKHHFHIQNVCGNGIEERLFEILKLEGNFKFIKDII